MATVKNWEAQAKTNSILASALKALETRVDDLETLLQWQAMADAKFEEIADTFAYMNDQIEDFKMEVDDNSLKLAGEMENLTQTVMQGGGGGGKGGKSFFQSRFGHSGGTRKAKYGGDEPDMLMDTTELKTMDVRKRIKLRFKDWGKIIKKDWQRIGTVGMLCLQVFAALLFLLEVFFTSDITIRFMSGTLFISLAASSFTGLYATWADNNKEDYSTRAAALYMFLCLQMWGIAAGAIQMQSAAREAVKLEQYCEIDRWSAPLLGAEAEQGCDRGTLWAQFKVLLGLFTVVTGLFLNWTFLIFKARLDEDKFTEKIPKICGDMIKKSRAPRAKSMFNAAGAASGGGAPPPAAIKNSGQAPPALPGAA